MTYQIELEMLGPLGADGFAKLVDERIATLREYDAHEAIVRQHAATPDMVDPFTTLPVPEAPIEIEAAIRRSGREDGTSEFAADYELVGPSFEVKKARLFRKVDEAEAAALLGVLPMGKVRAFQIREMDIRNSVSVSDEDRRFLDEQGARADRRNEIMRHAAQLHSDIEDLSPDTIDAWEMKPF